MFETLSDRLQAALSDVKGRGQLTEQDVAKAMRQVRLALLEADVNFQVVKQFTSQVKERAMGAEVLEALNPGQQVVKLVDEELTALMGGAGRDLVFSSKPPTVILMAGLRARVRPPPAASSPGTCARSTARRSGSPPATCTARRRWISS